MVLKAHTSLMQPPIMAAMAVAEAMEVTDIRLPVHKPLAVAAEATAETQLVRVAAVMALPTTVKAETLMLQRHQDVQVNPVSA